MRRSPGSWKEWEIRWASNLLLFEDSSDQPVIGIVGPQQSRLTPESEPVEVLAPSLVRARNKLYEAVSVPINIGTENLGTLIVGNEFDIHGWSEFGNMALIQNGRVLLTTFADSSIGDAEQQVQEKCVSTAGECEVKIGGETYLGMPLRQETFRDSVRLLSFQSIDAATQRFTGKLPGTLPADWRRRRPPDSSDFRSRAPARLPSLS